MLLYVTDTDTDEYLGEIEPADTSEILECLEDSDYIEAAEDCTVILRSDGDYNITENGDAILRLSLTEPELDEEEEEDDEELDEDDED